MDFDSSLNAVEISMFSDATKNPSLGFGAVCDDSWSFAQWNPDFITDKDPSIAYLELYALVVTVTNWLDRFQNKRIVLFCDNQSLVHMVNNMTSSCKNCMVLVRMLVLKCLTENCRVFACYVKSEDNKAADYLSRLKFNEFFELKNMWDPEPTLIPKMLNPVEKLWVN